jgi:hypothetical protein
MKNLIILFLLVASNAISQSPEITTTFYSDESFSKPCKEAQAKYVKIEEKLSKKTFSTLIKGIASDKTYHFSKYIDGEPWGLWTVGSPSALRELDYDFTTNYGPKEFTNTPIYNAMTEQGLVLSREFQMVMMRKIQANLHYPELARDKRIKGKVYLIFFINMRGEVVYAYVRNGTKLILDKEAQRLVYGLSPLSITPKDPNTPSNTLFNYSIPINFQIR